MTMAGEIQHNAGYRNGGKVPQCGIPRGKEVSDRHGKPGHMNKLPWKLSSKPWSSHGGPGCP